MARRRVRGVSTNTLLIGGALLAAYLFTRPKPPALPYPPGYGYPPGYVPPVNQTTVLAGDATSVLNNLFNNIF